MENYRILLGSSEYNDLVFANFGIFADFGYSEFKVALDLVRPFNATDYNKKEGIESYLEHCFSEKERLELCEKYSCQPSSLVETLAKEWDVTEIVNCDDYDFCITIDDKVWRFEYIDTIPMEDKSIIKNYVNKDIYDTLFRLQQDCESKVINNNIEQQIKSMQVMCDKFKKTEEQWIIEHIRKHLMV